MDAFNPRHTFVPSGASLGETAALLDVTDVRIEGYAQDITLRLYRRAAAKSGLPILLYFHGGGFVRGSIEEADYAARYFAQHTPGIFDKHPGIATYRERCHARPAFQRALAKQGVGPQANAA